MSVADNKKGREPLYESRNAAQDVAGDEKAHVRFIQDAARQAQEDFGQCEHGKPLLFGKCKECAVERTAKARERFVRAVDAKATAEACGLCGCAIAEGAPVVVRKLFTWRSYLVAPVCTECGHLEPDKALPCYWCERPVAMDHELFASRNRSGIFCCDRCRSKWHNRRNSAIRKRQRQRYLAKTCEVCGEEFTATRVDTKTCSPACKQKGYRQRKGSV